MTCIGLSIIYIITLIKLTDSYLIVIIETLSDTFPVFLKWPMLNKL